MSTHREIEEVYKDDIIKKSKMIGKYWSDNETLGEIVEAAAETKHSDFSWYNMNVYFILDEKSNAVKIGQTARAVAIRLEDIQRCNPNKLKVIGVIPRWSGRCHETEEKLHHRFRKLLIHGEWFKYEGRLKSYIEKLS